MMGTGTDATNAAITLDGCTLLCFSHLRWDFVHQRPQHLMRRFARTCDVIYWEEPSFVPQLPHPILHTRRCTGSAVTIVTPTLPAEMTPDAQQRSLRTLLDELLTTCRGPLVRWYYTPLMLPFSRHVIASATAYDCMDELANFRFAPPDLIPLEQQLLGVADVVFTGGRSLYESRKHRHQDVHLMPSSVDREHFARARAAQALPADIQHIPEPRIGFFGVIDERMDLALIEQLADDRPDWSLVFVGPLAKIDESDLPRRANIHWLGARSYAQLPGYLSGWDVAIMPFAINASTQFISPTKTPEYLAGGRPIVSTAIADVQQQYGEQPGVFIADSHDAFVAACDSALTFPRQSDQWLAGVDAFLETQSWDITHQRMAACLARHIGQAARPRRAPARHERYDFLIVGAGFAGAVLAERLASANNAQVLVIDKRDHIGGNAHDRLDEAGVLIHLYGPHIFHTNSDAIVRYLSQFTSWRPYEHRVLAAVRDRLVPIPINRTTINRLFDSHLGTDEEVATWLAARALPAATGLRPQNAEQVVLSAVGRELYELFFEGYTRKQWGVPPAELDGAVTARIPARTSDDDRYFQDRYQIMPAAGYTAMFAAMLDHPRIDVATGVAWQDVRRMVAAGHVIFTGPIDEYFDFRFGRLPYRSLRFDHQTLNAESFQPVAVINYPDAAVPYTRITEYKHLTGQLHPRTSITYEYPSDTGDPYYPMPTETAQRLYRRYHGLAEASPEVTFAGRLGTYRYYNMDQVVGQALATFKRLSLRFAHNPARETHRSVAI